MRSLSVQWKITLLSGLCLILTSVSLIGFSIYNGYETQRTIREHSTQSVVSKSEKLLEAQSQQNATQAIKYLEEALYRAEMLGKTSLFLQQNAEDNFTSSEDLRTSLQYVLRQSVESFDTIQSAYLVYKEDALDGEDSNYHGADYVGSNENGRFATLWSKSTEAGQAESRVISEAELSDEDNSEMFRCPLLTGQSCISSPSYLDIAGKQVFTSSISYPLMRDNDIIGFIGIVIDLSKLQLIAQETDNKLFDGKGRVSIVSASGTLVASDEQSSAIGSSFQSDSLTPSEFAQLAQSKQLKTVWSRDQDWLIVFAPAKIANQHWGVLLEVPASSVLADANTLDSLINKRIEKSISAELFTGLLLVFFGLGIIAFVSKSLVKPIKEVVVKLFDIASGEGDLTQRLEVKNSDEIGQLARGFNLFLDKLQPIIQDVIRTADKVADITAHSGESVTQTKNSSEAQFKEVDLVATASEEMTQTAALVLQNADMAVEAAAKANDAATQGQQVIEYSVTQMNRLVEQMSRTVPVVEELAANNANITEILAVIEGVSAQTNLLALNAAIEAARAGEHGRGFAVVADEVRTLAGSTQKSVSEIQSVIEKIQSGTTEVVSAIHDGNVMANETLAQIDQAVTDLRCVFNAITEINDMNSQIVRAAQEQKAVSSEVNHSVNNIRELSAKILEQAESSEKVGRDISSLSVKQQDTVNQFKV